MATKTNLSKIDPNAEEINLSDCALEGELDFSKVKKLSLANVDLSKVTKIKFNPNGERISLHKCTGIKCKLDFGNVKHLGLYFTDFSNVTEFKLTKPKNGFEVVDASDFSKVKKLCLNGVDLVEFRAGQIKFNPNAEEIDLSNCHDLDVTTDLDFSGVKSLCLKGVNSFDDMPKIKFNPNAEKIDLRDCALEGELDFSGVKELNLEDADLSLVTEIKFNSKGKVTGYNFKQKLTVGINKIVNKIKPKPKSNIVSKDRGTR